MPKKKSREYYVGVDLGGTKILAGVFNPSLQCLGTTKLSTKGERGASAVIERVARCVREAVDECDLRMDQVCGVGLGAPGAVDSEHGRVIFAPNLRWEDVPLKKLLEKELGVPVRVENDCNAATLGVHEMEFKGKPRYLVGIFVGTGIGAGFILEGQLYSGFNRTAGEIGHMVLDVNGPRCGCGNQGCLEALASRTAVFNRIQAAVAGGQQTMLTLLLGQDLKDMRSGDLRKAIRRGDKFVAQVVGEAAQYLGVAVVNLINLLSPEVVVLGGGMLDALEDEIMPIVQKTVRERAFPGTLKHLEIRASKLGDDAGIHGAAVLARQETR